MSAPDGSGETGAPAAGRASARAPVTIRCEVRIGFEKWHLLTVRDLSPEGFQIDWPRRCGDSLTLRIRIPGLEALPAEVRWREHGGAGCRFVAPLSPYVFEHIVRAAR